MNTNGLSTPPSTSHLSQLLSMTFQGPLSSEILYNLFVFGKTVFVDLFYIFLITFVIGSYVRSFLLMVCGLCLSPICRCHLSLTQRRRMRTPLTPLSNYHRYPTTSTTVVKVVGFPNPEVRVYSSPLLWNLFLASVFL